MNNNPIVVLVVEPGQPPTLDVLDGSLESMQRVVGGFIEEYMPFEDEVAIVCNEEGKICGAPLNRAIHNEDGEIVDVIAGTFFVCYAPADSENFLSLTPELIYKYAEEFGQPERIFINDGQVVSLYEDKTYNEFLGVKYRFHEGEDTVDIQFFVDEGLGDATLDWYVVNKGSDEHYIRTIARSLAGNLAIDSAFNIVDSLAQGKTVDEILNEAEQTSGLTNNNTLEKDSIDIDK